MSERRAPVQAFGHPWLGARHPARDPDAHPEGTVSWDEHVEAWQEYDKRWRSGQSAERIAERGGFCWGELRDFLGHAPKTWEPR